MKNIKKFMEFINENENVNKNNAILFLKNKLDKSERIEKYPELFLNDKTTNKTMFKFNDKNRHFYVSEDIWEILRNEYNLKYSIMRDIIQRYIIQSLNIFVNDVNIVDVLFPDGNN